MPNTAVKPANAESTWGEAPWEDRKPLISEKSTGKFQCFFAIRRGRPKGRPAVIFDHSLFRMMVRRTAAANG